MMVFHVQQVKESLFVCSHHVPGTVCVYLTVMPVDLAHLSGNRGSIHVLFQIYHLRFYQPCHRRLGNRIFTDFSQNCSNMFWNKILHEIQDVCQVNKEMQESMGEVLSQGKKWLKKRRKNAHLWKAELLRILPQICFSSSSTYSFFQLTVNHPVFSKASFMLNLYVKYAFQDLTHLRISYFQLPNWCFW